MYKLSVGLGTDPDSHFAIATDLVGSGFFYATWSCEISTTPNPGKTKILDLDGITFRNMDGSVVPHDDPNLHLAFRVTVLFCDQKNKTKSDSQTQECTGDPVLCPVTCLSSLICRIRRTIPSFSGSTSINAVAQGDSVNLLTSSCILDRLHYTCTFFGS